MESIGFVGLGIMGRPMVKNLLAAGYPVSVWNRSRPGIDECLEAGASEEASPAAVAAGADVFISMVTDSPDVESVLSSPGGAIEALRAGSLVVDMSTISPAVTRDIAARLAENGVTMLDAPVSGGDAGAMMLYFAEQALHAPIEAPPQPEHLERCRGVLGGTELAKG